MTDMEEYLNVMDGFDVNPGDPSEPAKNTILCGARLWGLEGTDTGYVRFHWMRTCWDLLTAALTQLSLQSPGKAVELPAEEPPPFDRVCAGLSDADTLVRAMRSRWRAAEDLRARGFYAEAIIFYGSLVEAVLVTYLEQVLPPGITNSAGLPISRWKPHDLFKAAGEQDVLHPLHTDLKEKITAFRNLIHIQSSRGRAGLHNETTKETAAVFKELVVMLVRKICGQLELPRD
jgi:hypothetical protein